MNTDEHLETAAKACHRYNPCLKYSHLTWEEVPTSQQIAYERQAQAAIDAWVGDRTLYELRSDKGQPIEGYTYDDLAEFLISVFVLVKVSDG